MAENPKWDDRERHAADVDFSAFKKAVEKTIAGVFNMHPMAELAAVAVSNFSEVAWSFELTEQFGQHPPRIFHEGP